MSCPVHGSNCPYKTATANQIISEFKKGEIRRVFPSEYLEKTFAEIVEDASRGIKNARTAKKLLEQARFNKDSKS